MAFESKDVFELLALTDHQPEVLRALREESARQTELLRQLLARLGSFERTQYS